MIMASSEESNQLESDAIFAAALAAQDDEPTACDSDATLASMLQRQFDREYNEQITRQESRLNGQSKVGVSLDKYRRQPVEYDDTVDSGDDFSDDDFPYSGTEIGQDARLSAKKSARRTGDNRVWDRFEQSEIDRRGKPLGRAGFVVESDGSIITKHDLPTTSRRNMCRLMELKCDIETGDAGNKQHDFGLNNYVYNRLKVHSKKNERRSTQREFDRRERETATVLDDIQSFRMSNATKTIISGLLVNFTINELNGVVGHGKEATVLHGVGRNHDNTDNQEVAIKVFKTNSPELKTRDLYTKTKCPSYKFDRLRSKNDAHGHLKKWVENEYKNLKLMRRANINCPDAISLKKHLLVMTFIGEKARPSPQLKEVNLTHEQLADAYEQVKKIMVTLYNDCELVHADLSEYNLLWHSGQVYVIDVTQSIEVTHPNANKYLYRDCETITQYFARNGLEDMLEPKQLFAHICSKDLSYRDIEIWNKIEDFPRNAKQSMQAFLIVQSDMADNAEPMSNGADPFDQLLSMRATQVLAETSQT